MHNKLYYNITNVLTPGSTPYDLGMSVSNIAYSDIMIRRLEYGGSSHISRKDRQYDFKDKDAKNAVIMIMNTNTSESTLIEKVTDKFLLHNIQKEHTEKVQLMETFDENLPSITFFGKKTPVYAFTGTLFNNNTFSPGQTELKTQWAAGFELYWREHLRGSVLAKENKIAVMILDDELYEGYPITLSIQKNSSNDHTVNFSMSWIITKADTLIAKDALRKYMFFQDDKSLQETFIELKQVHGYYKLFNDFLHEYSREEREQEQNYPISMEVASQFLLDAEVTKADKIATYHYVPSGDSSSTTYIKKIKYVDFTKKFKSAITYIEQMLEKLVDNDPLEIPADFSWIDEKKVTTITISKETANGFYEAKVRLQRKIDDLTQRYNQLLSEL